MPVVLYHIVDSAARSRKPIRIIELEKAPDGGGDGEDGGSGGSSNIKVSKLSNYLIEHG